MPEDEFDYQQIDEQPDTLNFNERMPCPHCRKLIPVDSTLCLFCGEKTYGTTAAQPAWIVWLVIALIVIFGVYVMPK